MTFRRLILGLVGVLLVAGLAYTGYVGYEGSRQLIEGGGSHRDCRTPDQLFGWTYEAINYDIADDAELVTRNTDQKNCTDTGTLAGDEVVTDDGIRLAGWYIPSADGAGPTAPTVVLVHGFGATKTGILEYGEGLHGAFNLVAFDMRNTHRSSGDQTTVGVREQKDLRAIIDWLEQTKHPSHIGVLGNSMGAVTAVAEAVNDPRVEALALDSMHTRMRYQVEQRLQHAGHPAYPGTWAIFLAAQAARPAVAWNRGHRGSAAANAGLLRGCPGGGGGDRAALVRGRGPQRPSRHAGLGLPRRFRRLDAGLLQSQPHRRLTPLMPASPAG